MPLLGFPVDFQPPTPAKLLTKRQVASGSMIGLNNRDLLNPPYAIANAAGALSQKTLNTDLIHAGTGYAEYDTHNLYGTMMSAASRQAMLARRPSVRPLIITRSTFAGAGAQVGHWLGDNAATWHDYQLSIASQLGFAFIYQVPMVGSDVCGYAENTTETLCARWATLGAFSTFYRNHENTGSIPHEFYRWPLVADAARNAISIRYRLLDYIYTAVYQQSVDGTPALNPLWAFYPNDANTYGIDLQFFFGQYILVSPVTDENATSVSIYLPNDQYYDFYTLEPVRGTGASVDLSNIDFTSIPLHIRGGAVIPMRNQGAVTTTALRKNDFNILIAPDLNGKASGILYLDDGVSLVQASTSKITFGWDGKAFTIGGSFGYDMDGVEICAVAILGVKTKPATVCLDGRELNRHAWVFNGTSMVVDVTVDISLSSLHTLTLDH